MRFFSFRFFVFFFVFIDTFFNCQRKLIKKDELELLNEYYGDRTYYLKENIQVNNKERLEKGTSVKIWIESTSSLLKIKCYPSQSDRESAVGKMVTYLINEDLKNSELTIQHLEGLIGEKLTAYVPKEAKRVKSTKK